MFEKLKATLNVSDEHKAKNRAINKIFKKSIKRSLSETLVWILSLSAASIVLLSVFNTNYQPGKIATAICFISYGGLMGMYLYKNITEYYGETSVAAITGDVIENDCLYKIIKNNPAKFPPELSNYLEKWKAEEDEKERNKLFRKLIALFELCCENEDARTLSKPTKATYEKIIGTLLETCIRKAATESQSTITEDIIDLYQASSKDKHGLSLRNIADIFSEANRIQEAAVIRRSHLK